MPSKADRHSNSRIGPFGSRRFGTPLPMNTGGGSSSQGGATSAAGSPSSSRRYTVPSSDRRGGKRSASQGRGSRNQRARIAHEENDGDADPIEDAMELVEVNPDQLLAANTSQVTHLIGESVARQRWTPALSCTVACQMLKRAGCPVAIGQGDACAPSRIPGESTAVSSIPHQVLLLSSDFRTGPNWWPTVTMESSAVLKGGFLMYAQQGPGATKNFRDLARAINKDLKAALSVLHKGERAVASNLAGQVTRAVYYENNEGKGKRRLVESPLLFRTVRRTLLARRGGWLQVCVVATRHLKLDCTAVLH
eukprot:g18424.t1